MARMRKKLKQKDINKNSSVEVSHTIKRIKENELKYTIVLVVFFMFIFGVFGYLTLRVSNDKIAVSNIKNNVSIGFNSAIQGEVIFLDKHNIMSDVEGLRTNGYQVDIENTTNNSFIYQIYLSSYDNQIELCGCKDRIIDPKYIRYSLDGIITKSLDSNNGLLLTEVPITGRVLKRLNIRIWLDESLDKNSDYHYHGYLKMKK